MQANERLNHNMPGEGPLIGLRHRNLAAVPRMGTVDGIPFVEMDDCGGPSLDRVIARGCYTIRDAVKWVIGVLRGLSFMHASSPSANIHEVLHSLERLYASRTSVPA